MYSLTNQTHQCTSLTHSPTCQLKVAHDEDGVVESSEKSKKNSERMDSFEGTIKAVKDSLEKDGYTTTIAAITTTITTITTTTTN